jgi:hypothetical protein
MSEIEKANQLFLKASDLKDIARKDISDNDRYLEAAQLYEQAASLCAGIGSRSSDADEKGQCQVLEAYYLYEAEYCQQAYLYEKRDTAGAKLHHAKCVAHLEHAISMAESLALSLSPAIAARMTSNLRVWKFYRLVKNTDQFAPDARAAWDAECYVEALDFYRRMAELQQVVVANARTQMPKYERISIGNQLGMLANAAQATVKILASYDDFSQVAVLRLFHKLFAAYQFGEKAAGANPEWPQYRESTTVCADTIQKMLKQCPDKWLIIYAEFEEEPEFLRLMKHTDLKRFKVTERARHLVENKLLNLWIVGSFFLLLFGVVIAAVVIIVHLKLPWYIFIACLFFVEGVILIIGAFCLRTVGDLSEQSFLKLIVLALRFQFKGFKAAGSEDTKTERTEK